MSQQHLLIAVDGGGTKTEYCVYDTISKKQQFFRFGSSNYKSVGLAEAQNNIIQAFESLFQKLEINDEQIIGIVFGLSGCDSVSDYQVYQRMTKRIPVLPEKIRIYNDCELTLLALSNPPAIGLVAGTGSNAYAFAADGRKARCGGWGNLVSDEGSGFWIGQKVLSDMLLFAEKREKFQPVFNLLCNQFETADLSRIPEQLGALDVPQIASAAKTVLQEAEKGDAYCQAIVSAAVESLIGMTRALYIQMEFEHEQHIVITTTGSLFKNSYFCNLFKNALCQLRKDGITLEIASEKTSGHGIEQAKKIFKLPAQSN